MTNDRTTYEIQRSKGAWVLTERGQNGALWGIYQIPNARRHALTAWLEGIMSFDADIIDDSHD